MRPFLFIVFALSFLCPAFGDETDLLYSIQNWDAPATLDSKVAGKWLWTAKPIDPVKVSGDLLQDSFRKEGWQETEIPKNLFADSGGSSGSEVYLAKTFVAPNSWKSTHIAIRMGVIDDRDEVFWNGQLIGKTGKFGSKDPQGYDKIRIYSVPDQLIRKGEKNVLVVHIQSYFNGYIGLVQDTVKIGPSEEIESELEESEYGKLLILMIYATVGGYFLFLFVRRRKESENLYFAIFTIVMVTYQILKNQIRFEFGIPFHVMKKFEYMCLPIMLPALFHFMRTLFGFRYRWHMKLADGLAVIAFIYYSVGSNIQNFSNVFLYGIQPIWLYYTLACVAVTAIRVFHKNRDAYYIMGGLLVIIMGALLDTLSNWYIINFPEVFGYSFFFFILSLATVLANKFVRMSEEIEELNADLEAKVIERTKELNETLEQVQSLKVQQDGDYFLTRLLLDPLFVNRNLGERVKAEFFVRQKKSFVFKENEYDIGGDICIVDTILLEGGEPYAAILNGDAMGKSMQGAGGALVAGVVFNAVLTRTRISNYQTSNPEVWLKEAFIELQSVFETFDGSMLCSVVIGLVSHRNGFFYYINAEHPWNVLYRDGVAEFLETDLSVRKLGFPENLENLQIKTFQLMPEDVVFIGSDGRDDLQIGSDQETGQRIINSDENLFLQKIRESDGNLDILVGKLKETGEITDDLSLLRLEYVNLSKDFPREGEIQSLFEKGQELLKAGQTEDALESFESALEIDPIHPSVNEAIGKLHFKQKRWKSAIPYLESASKGLPERDDILLYLSYTYKKIRHYEKALEFGERLKLRDPDQPQNLLNLADIYAKMGDFDSVRQIIKKAEDMDKLSHQAEDFIRKLRKNLP